MKTITKYLLAASFSLLMCGHAQAAFVVKKNAVTYTAAKSEQKIVRSESRIMHWFGTLHPKIQMLSQSNGYKALMCGLIGVVVLSMGLQAIKYANADLKGAKENVLMARTGKVMGIVDVVLVGGLLIGLLFWFASKNPSSAQAAGQAAGDILGDMLQAIADDSGN